MYSLTAGNTPYSPMSGWAGDILKKVGKATKKVVKTVPLALGVVTGNQALMTLGSSIVAKKDATVDPVFYADSLGLYGSGNLQTLPPAYVQSTRPAQPNYTPYLLAGAGVLAVALIASRR